MVGRVLDQLAQGISSQSLRTFISSSPHSLRPKNRRRVIIQDKEQPRGTWHLGRIDTVISGSDGQVRSARVLLPSQRVLTRPLSHLFPLEIPISSDDNIPQSVLLDPSENIGNARQSGPTVSDTSQRPTRSFCIRSSSCTDEEVASRRSGDLYV